MTRNKSRSLKSKLGIRSHSLPDHVSFDNDTLKQLYKRGHRLWEKVFYALYIPVRIPFLDITREFYNNLRY